MRVIDAAALANLEAGRIIDRGMILFDLPSGFYGFWTGAGPFVWNNITFQGVGKLIEVEALTQVSDGSAVPVTARLSSIPDSSLTPDILATIEDEAYHQRPVLIYTAYFHPDTRALLSVELEYRGYIDRVVQKHKVGGGMVLEAMFESKARDMQKTGFRMRSSADQEAIDISDTGLRHVAQVAQVPINWGRETPATPEAKREAMGV